MTRSLHVRSRLALAFLLLTVPVARAAQRAGAKGEERLRRYAILDLGPVLADDADGAPSINQRGQVALSTASGAVLWEEGRRRLLTGLAGACDLDERGQVVGWSAGASRRAGLWRSGKVEPVGPVNGVAESVALAISPSGRIVGSYRVEGSAQERSFLHDKGNAMDLVDLGGAAVLARDLNAPETIVGCTTTASGEEHAFSWDRGRMSALTGLGSESTAEALNNPGVIVGRSRTASGAWRGYQRKGGKLSFLAPLPGGTDVVPLDINERGQIVGSSRNGAREHAVLIEKGQTIDLNERLPEGTSGWELRSATAINASGSIVGLGVHAGQAVAFLLQPMVERPNVLILLGDDFNWDDLHSVAMPHIDALAARGMTFTNHYTFPLCSLTRYSLVFGRYPRRDGIGNNVNTLPPSATNPTPPLGLPSIASVWSPASEHIYQTALIGKWHLGTNPFYDGDPGPDVGLADYGALTPLLHGFDHFLAGSMANLIPGGYFQWQRVDDGVYSASTEYAPQAQLTSFRAFWDGGRSPRIAYVAPNLAHEPHQRPPDDWLPAGYPPDLIIRQTFEAMLVAFDEFVGRVLAEVDLENTYVFLLSDNGTQRSVSITPCARVSPNGCTKETTFQGGIHMPLFVAGPRIPAGTTSSAVVSSTDIMATVAQILDLSSPGEDSVSYWPTLLDPEVHVRRYTFSETVGRAQRGEMIPGATDRAAIGERYKLRVANGRETLFDLQLDPREGFPLDRSDPALQVVLAELRAVLANPLDRQRQL